MRKLNVEEMDLVAGAAAGGIQGPNVQTKNGWQNNGLGNLDQPAPGNSLDNNGAENNTGGNTTGNPPGSGKWDVIPD
jgi:hypothetical protein